MTVSLTVDAAPRSTLDEWDWTAERNAEVGRRGDMTAVKSRGKRHEEVATFVDRLLDRPSTSSTSLRPPRSAELLWQIVVLPKNVEEPDLADG